VIVADLVMSIDNVIAVAAAAKGSLDAARVRAASSAFRWSIVGAQLIMKIIERMPILIVAGGGLLGYIAGDSSCATRR
jgi:predicted tellurium resistance membrane protein TerC